MSNNGSLKGAELDRDRCNGFFIPDYAEDYMNQYCEFEVRDDDIYIACYPKCGTTWVQHMVYLIVHGFDFEDPAGENIDFRVPYIEYFEPGIEDVKARQGLRIMKTHMPYSLLPPPIHKGKSKVITIARNPKDMAVSLYHFMLKLKPFDFNGDFESFMRLFLDDKVIYAPYSKYLEEFWHHRNDKNILFLSYEDMKRDLSANVIKVANFLNHKLSHEMVDKITQHCSFTHMEKDPTVNYTWWEEDGRAIKEGKFMRKGEVGDWKNYFTEDYSAKIEDRFKHIEELGLTFTYEL